MVEGWGFRPSYGPLASQMHGAEAYEGAVTDGRDLGYQTE